MSTPSSSPLEKMTTTEKLTKIVKDLVDASEHFGLGYLRLVSEAIRYMRDHLKLLQDKVDSRNLEIDAMKNELQALKEKRGLL